MSLITSATTYDYESVSYLHEEKQRMFVWGRNIYLVQLLSAATPGMTSPVRKRVPVGQICNRLQAQMDSETGTTSTPLSPNASHSFLDSPYLMHWWVVKTHFPNEIPLVNQIQWRIHFFFVISLLYITSLHICSEQGVSIWGEIYVGQAEKGFGQWQEPYVVILNKV